MVRPKYIRHSAKFALVLVIIFAVLVIFGCIALRFAISRSNTVISDSQNYHKHRVILVVLDAFRHDYMEIFEKRKIELPNIRRMMNDGSRVMKMVPVFPTVTMPNHQTLITGLYSPYHGITYNTFNDSSFNFDRFAMSNQSSLNEDRWYKGYPDPIWVTCEKLPNCKSGSMLWPNTDAFIDGYRPSRKVDQYFLLTEMPHIYPYDRRVDEMIKWIKDDLIDFGMLYFDEPDATSHKYGPLHDNTLNKLIELDGWIGRFLKGINEAGLADSVDILLTGDHGMTELSEDRIINIDSNVPPELYVSTYSYPVGIIYPIEGYENRVYDSYKNASSHIQVFRRNEIPEKYHYKDNANRISPIVTIVELGWVVNSSHYVVKMKGGTHGYDQDEPDMHTTLIAFGPSFKHKVIEKAKHVDLYSLMMHLLGMKANPNNGSFNALSGMLKESALSFVPRENRWSFDKFVLFLISILIVQISCCFFFLIFYVYIIMCKRQFFIYDKRGHMVNYDKEHQEALISSP